MGRGEAWAAASSSLGWGVSYSLFVIPSPNENEVVLGTVDALVLLHTEMASDE